MQCKEKEDKCFHSTKVNAIYAVSSKSTQRNTEDMKHLTSSYYCKWLLFHQSHHIHVLNWIKRKKETRVEGEFNYAIYTF